MDNIEENNFVEEIISQDNEIHIYKNIRGKKCDTVISGLLFKKKDETKDFLTNIKKRFGVGGCYKMIPEINKTDMVYVFMGDYRDKIRNVLINEYDIKREMIKMHS